MFPRRFFDTYWRTDIREEVFVAMPFHDEFDGIWNHCILPAIESNRGGLLARRVDASTLSGSIVVNILDGIAHSRAVFCDISVCESGRWAGQRNGNVMYEVGLAHATRQDTEVILVRKDREPINFDLAGINVHWYDSTDVSKTKDLFDRLITSAIDVTNQEKSLQVSRAISMLDHRTLGIIERHRHGPGFRETAESPSLSTMANMAAISRLQSIGIVECSPNWSEQKADYIWTPFGRAVLRRLWPEPRAS